MEQYNVTGMSCAACSARVEKAVSKVPGVTACSVSLLTNSMGVEGDVDDEVIIKFKVKTGNELVNEGILREIIRNAQVLRKEADFKIDDRIDINITSIDESITEILNNNKDKIESEVLAKNFNTTSFTPDIQKKIEVGEGVVVHYELRVSK